MATTSRPVRHIGLLMTATALLLSAPLPLLASGDGGSLSSTAANRNDERISLFLGQAQIVRLPFPARRVAVADDKIADFRLIGPSELYVLGKSVGRTNILIWDRNGMTQAAVIDVGIDLQPLETMIHQQLPTGNQIEISNTAASIVLGGTAGDTVAANAAVRLAEAHAATINQAIQRGEKSGSGSAGQSGQELVRVVNLMKIRDAQQVMLEVRIAEVSKSVVDRLGLKVDIANPNGSMKWNIGSNFLGSGGGTASMFFTGNGSTYQVDLDAERRRGTVKILAEPTIVAMSGEEGSFLVGGKVFIPVAQAGGGTGNITLEERQFGVGLHFLPTVLDGGRINLRVSPEVSELSKEPLSFSNGQSTSVLPAFTTSRVSTTVQLRDGQSLVIGGLLRNTSVKSLKGLPLLSQIPVLGALFRSDDFSSDKTELVVVVRPTLVSGQESSPPLPTDEVKKPSSAAPSAPAADQPSPTIAPAEPQP
jgi:pilus assembly protein CpaC